MTDGLGTTNFTYTAVGTAGALKIASIDGPYANDIIGLTYDALGRLSGRSISGGNETFGYDALSRLATHASPLGTFNYGYLGQTSQTASRSVTNGAVTVSTNWGYDSNANDRRLISIVNSGVTRSYTLGYGSSPVNPYDIMSITDTAATGHPFASQPHNYSYDNVDRLLTASFTSPTPGSYSYGYDNLDNATSVTDPGIGSITPTYNGLNQVQTFNTNTYSYDANGNTTTDNFTQNYKWDAENRLIEIDYIGTTAKSQFSYDGLGHRTVDVETDSGGNVTTQRFLWCESGICQIRNGSDAVQSRILNEGEFAVGSSQKAVYTADQLGSVRDVLDATTGNLISSIDYSPYGNPIQTTGTFTPFYQYARLTHHAQSNLNLATFRAQDGIIGRFPNIDPIREAGGINLYGYVSANPVNKADPLGLVCADKKAQCAALLASIQAQYAKLVAELNKYDPNTDWMGGFPISPKKGGGFTKPGGHFKKIEDLQRGLRNRIQQYMGLDCEDDDSQGGGGTGAVPSSILDAATQSVPSPNFPFLPIPPAGEAVPIIIRILR